MKEYTTESIRNIALASHSSAGKTLLTEAFLHFTGATTRMGKVEDGTTVSDFDEEEVRRGISIYTSVVPVEYKGTKINFLDTPGYTDFVGEMISALRVADGAVILVDSVAGLEVGTELAWDYCNTFKLPRFFVINKMERDHMEEVLSSLTEVRPKSAEILKGLLFTFDDIVNLAPRARTALFDQIPNDRVVLALKGTDEAFRNIILSSLASRVRRMVEHELNGKEPASQRDVLEARRAITDLALEMAGRGEIELNPENDGDTYIR